MRRRLALVAVVLAATVVVPGVAVAASTPTPTPDAGAVNATNESNATTAQTPDDGQYTIRELKQDGKHYSVPSARIVAEKQQVYWIEHRPLNQPWTDVTRKSGGKKLDGTLKTDTLYLRTLLASNRSQTMDVTLVFWERGTKVVQKGNRTLQKAYAANVSVVHREVTLEPGWSMAKINLPTHDEGKRVTMWLDEHPETARWTFNHRSVAFSQPVDADTWSEFVVLAGGFVILPALAFGAYGGKKVKAWIDKAGAPPGHGFGYYLLTTTIVSASLVLGAYFFVAELIVGVPIVLGLYVGLVYIGYMLATHEGRTEDKLFWRPHIEDVQAFTSTKLPSVGEGNDEQSLTYSEDMPFGTMATYKVLDEGQRGLSIVRNGWGAFLARLKGGRAKIENANELKTRFNLWNSPWDEAFIVDPEAEQLIDYEPPGLRLKTPDIDEWTDLIWPATVLLGGGVLAWQLAQAYGPAAWLTLGIAVPMLIWKFAVTGTDSYCRIEPAPAAERPVLASMLVLQMGHRDASSLEEAEEFAWRALAGREQEDMEWTRDRGETLIDEAFGEPERQPADAADEDEDGDGDPFEDIDDLDEDDRPEDGDDDEDSSLADEIDQIRNDDD